MNSALVNVECPRCGQKGQVPNGYVGQRLRCKNCNERFVLRISGWVEKAGRFVEEEVEAEQAARGFKGETPTQDQRPKVQAAACPTVPEPKALRVGTDPIWMFVKALERELPYLGRHTPVGLQRRWMLRPPPDVDIATLRRRRCDAACRFAEGVPIPEVHLYRVEGGILCVPLSAVYDPWFWPKGDVVSFWAPADYHPGDRWEPSFKSRFKSTFTWWEVLATLYLWPAYLIPIIGVLFFSLFELPAEFLKWLTRCLFSSGPKE